MSAQESLPSVTGLAAHVVAIATTINQLLLSNQTQRKWKSWTSSLYTELTNTLSRTTVQSLTSSITILLPQTAPRPLKAIPTLPMPSLLGIHLIVLEPNIFMMRLEHHFLSHSVQIPLLEVILHQGHSTHNTRVLRPHPRVSCHVHNIFNTDTAPPTAKRT